MKSISFIFLMLTTFSAILSAQNNYSWSEKKISLNSPIPLERNKFSSNFVLSGDGISITIETLGSMEGISGLAGSLESYAKSFYTNVGTASVMNGNKNLNIAGISAQKDGKNVIVCILATKDYKKHFACEITFLPNTASHAESIIKSISFGEGSEVVNNQNNNEIVNENNSGNNSNQNQENVGGFLAKGTTPPDFELTDINENPIKLSSLKGKTVLLDFWGTWCAPCVKLIPKLKELYDKYKANDFEILSVASDVDKTKWKNMVSAKEMTWTNVIDMTDKVTNQYSIKAFPTLMLIDKNGKIISSEISEPEVEKYLSEKTQVNVSNNQNTNINNNAGNSSINNFNPSSQKVKNTHFNGSAIEKKTWQLLADYSVDGYTILDEYYAAPSEYQGVTISGDHSFTQWIDGTSDHELVKSTNTVVHEMCHGYTGKLYLKMLKDAGKSFENGHYQAFYLGNGKSSLLHRPSVYVTSEMNSIFPPKLITSRYKTYVYPSEKIMGSQQDGAYGLLNELNAYYIGTKTSFDFYSYYATKYNSQEGWADFFDGFYSTFYAYLEFKSYILVYMIYAQQNHKDVYDAILADKDFLSTFKQIDENWTNLLLDYNKLKKIIIAEQKTKGLVITEDEGFIMMNGSGSGTFMETYNLFKNELRNEKYETVAKAMGLKTASGPDM